MKRTIGLLIFTVALPAYAETMYVSERLPTTLRAALADGSPIVKTVEGGTSLEVLERADHLARVRDAQGAEGWIEMRLLVATAPARVQLERAQTALTKARTDLAAAQTQIGQLEAKLSQTAASTTQPLSAEPAEPAPPVAIQAPSVDDEEFPWGWLVLAFAMLWLGFGAGIVWLRERHRKKLGGMYLRV